MVESKESRAHSHTVHEKENLPEEKQKTEEKEAVLLHNENRKKSALQKRRIVSCGTSGRTDMAEVRNQSDRPENQCPDDMLLEKMESLDVCNDDQGPPLSFKNIVKAVRTFSKRKPKSLKVPEVARERKETDVVVFERLATPQSFYKSHRMSSSLPPIMDIHELLSTEIQPEGEKRNRDLNCLHSQDVLQTSNTEEGDGARTPSEPSSQSPAVVKREFRRHRCSGFLHELEPDALQEFGSLGVSRGNRDHEGRIPRKSLGYFCNTYEEHEALHF